MAKYRDFARFDVLPASWTDGIQEYISTAVFNFKIEKTTAISVRVPAGVENEQVGIGIEGLWRYNTAAASATHPGGVAGVYDLYVTTGENVFSETPDPDTDLTDYSFGLVIKASGETPNTPRYRKVALIYWDGSEIYLIEPLVPVAGLPKHAKTHEPGGSDAMAVDAAAATGSLRTIGTGALQSASGSDDRFPTTDEKDALAGTSGSPSDTNRYVTDEDTRLSDSRPPGAHAATHAPGASDALNYTLEHKRGSGAPPSAAAAGLFYVREDDADGKTLYLSTAPGNNWEKVAAGADLIGAGGAPQYVTLAEFAALTPANGMEVYLIVDASQGILWHLRYNAYSGSAYKWESVGEGTALYARSHAVGYWHPHLWPKIMGQVDSGWLNHIGGYVGPTLSIPRPGDYYVKWGGHGWLDYYWYYHFWGMHEEAPTGVGWMALDGCGLIADPDGHVILFPHLHPGSVYKVRRVTLTAGTLSTYYRAYAYGVGYWLHLYCQDRTLEVVPIRIA